MVWGEKVPAGDAIQRGGGGRGSGRHVSAPGLAFADVMAHIVSFACLEGLSRRDGAVAGRFSADRGAAHWHWHAQAGTYTQATRVRGLPPQIIV